MYGIILEIEWNLRWAVHFSRVSATLEIVSLLPTINY
jgi:hypothetical protein